MIVSTERLGIPGVESERLERSGIAQRQLVYPTDSDHPSATSHLQAAERERALCGYQWEQLMAVPGAVLGLGPGWRFVVDPTYEDVWFDPILLDDPV